MLIGPQTVAGNEQLVLDLSDYFTHPNADTPLTFSATPETSPIVSITLVGSTLTLSPLSPGTAEITVSAADPDSRSATQAFNVTAFPTLMSELLGTAATVTPDSAAVSWTAAVDAASYDWTLAGSPRLNGVVTSASLELTSLSTGAVQTIHKRPAPTSTGRSTVPRPLCPC